MSIPGSSVVSGSVLVVNSSETVVSSFVVDVGDFVVVVGFNSHGPMKDEFE